MSDTATSLALCQRYAALTPEQQLMHDVQAIDAPYALRRLMPRQTRERLADSAFVERAMKLREAT